MNSKGDHPEDENDERTISNETDSPQEDDCDHHEDCAKWDPSLRVYASERIFEGTLDPGLQADVRHACEGVLDFYGLTGHLSAEDLERRVIRRFGRLLPRYADDAKREVVIKKLAITLLIRDAKQHDYLA